MDTTNFDSTEEFATIVPITPEQINTLGSILADIRDRTDSSDYMMPWQEEATYDDILDVFHNIFDMSEYSAELKAAVRNNY
jgi:hypothetical protein